MLQVLFLGLSLLATLVLAPLVTNVGKAALTAWLQATSTYSYIAIGTGATAEANTQTALVTEVETRVSGTRTQQTTTTTNDTFRCVSTLAITGTRALQESGLFDAASVGNMFCRGVYTTINLVNLDSVQITWNIQFT